MACRPSINSPEYANFRQRVLPLESPFRADSNAIGLAMYSGAWSAMLTGRSTTVGPDASILRINGQR